LSFVLEVADRVLVLEKGVVVYEAATSALDIDRVHAHLTLATHRGEPLATTPDVTERRKGASP
jgi:hypothetical protein